jgi:hypothetical protein
LDSSLLYGIDCHRILFDGAREVKSRNIGGYLNDGNRGDIRFIFLGTGG